MPAFKERRSIGIMQGRLSPIPHRSQAFPWKSWEEEFSHARELGFDLIEWLFDADNFEQNPIWIPNGIERINHLQRTYGVTVQSICAHYFMLHPFYRVSAGERTASVNVLKGLVKRAACIGVKVILLPVLEQAEISNPEDADLLVSALQDCLPVARACGVRLGLETELPAEQFESLVGRFDDSTVGAYYDVGNATAKGYDPAEDVRLLKNNVCGVHIKDRKRGGPNVFLGQGDVDFAACLSALNRVGYAGPIVLETPVGDDFFKIAKQHLSFVRGCLKSAVVHHQV